MAITLANAKELSNDKLTPFVIDQFLQSPILASLPFDNSVKAGVGQSLSYSYNRITTQPTAAGRALNNEYSPQETITTRYTVDLKPFGGSFELDRVIINHEVEVVNHIQFQLEQKVKATRALFHDWFINGDVNDSPTQFDGIDKAVTGTSTELTPTSQIDLSSASAIASNWNALLYYMRKLRAKLDGAPTLYLMNGDMFSAWQSVCDNAGVTLQSVQGFGADVLQWNDSIVASLGYKPGTSNPIIPIDAGVTSIYAVRFGLDGVHAVSPEGAEIVSTYLPDMQAPGAVKRGEVEMVAAVAVKSTQSAGVLRDILIEPAGS